MAIAIVGLGSNMGPRKETMLRAISLMKGMPEVQVLACSKLYETVPMGPIEQSPYLNAAVRLSTGLSLERLLGELHRMEDALGRTRDVRWGPRTMDLDILWSDAGPIQTPRLTVPHPRLTERPFALAPLLDVAPELSPLYGSVLETFHNHCGFLAVEVHWQS